MRPKRPGPAAGSSRGRRAAATGKRTVSDTAARGKSLRVHGSLDVLQRLPRRDLLALARTAGLRGWSRLRKEELVRVLATHAGIAPSQGGLAGASVPLESGDAPLPETYGEDRLVLLPIDPYWVHAYWELTPTDRPAGGDAWFILRVYDVTGIDFDGSNADSYFDIDLDPDARNWYINLGSPGKSLCAELGRILQDGTFSPRVRSNAIQTPAAGVSLDAEERWVRVEWNKAGGRFGESGGSPKAAGSPRQSASPDATPHDPELSLDLQGSRARVRPVEFMREEDYRGFLEGVRRAQVLGTAAPTEPGLTGGARGRDIGGGISSDHWIRKTERGRKAEG
jgi:hypothetical protein